MQKYWKKCKKILCLPPLRESCLVHWRHMYHYLTTETISNNIDWFIRSQLTWLEQRIDSNKTIITIILSHLGTMYYLLLSLHTIIIRGQMVIIDTYTTCQAWIIPKYIVKIGSCFLSSAQNEIFKNYDQLQLQLIYN